MGTEPYPFRLSPPPAVGQLVIGPIPVDAADQELLRTTIRADWSAGVLSR